MKKVIRVYLRSLRGILWIRICYYDSESDGVGDHTPYFRLGDSLIILVKDHLFLFDILINSLLQIPIILVLILGVQINNQQI